MAEFNWISWTAAALVLLRLWAFFSIASNAASLVPTIQPIPASGIADDMRGWIDPFQTSFR